MRLALLVAAVILAACTPAPRPIPPASLDGGASPAAVLCQHLADLGCSDGAERECPVVVERVMRTGLIRLDVACVAAATTRDDARLCQGVRCEP